MNTRLGISLKILSALCVTLMLACVKGLHGAIPTGEVIFFRSFIAMFPLFFWLKCQGNILHHIRTKNLFGHFIRGFSGTGGMYFGYMALIYILLGQRCGGIFRYIDYAIRQFIGQWRVVLGRHS